MNTYLISSPPIKLYNVYSEVTWGRSYRNLKSNLEKKPINPKHSPINVPFKLCRYLQSLQKPPAIEPESTSGEVLNSSARRSGKKSKNTIIKQQLKKQRQTTLLERSAMSQKDYMDLLSIPNNFLKLSTCGKHEKHKKTCSIEPCPPRINEMAVPKKRVVYDNWKLYENLLRPEMLLRFQEILKSGKNLDPIQARYYFKKLDRIRRRKKRKQNRLKRMKKRKLLQKDVLWLKRQINDLVSLIVDHVRSEPYYALNYNQMLLANKILEVAKINRKWCKPKIRGKVFDETITEISDKLAVWADGVINFVNQQPLVDGIPDEESVHEEEEEEEYETESEELGSEEERGEEQFSLAGEDRYVEEYEEISDVSSNPETVETAESSEAEAEELVEETQQRVDEELVEETQQGVDEEFDEAEEQEINLSQLSEDILDKLITILSNCPDDFLDNLLDNDKMPGVRYLDVLNKLKLLQDGQLPSATEKPFLEQTMINWANQNDPDRVDNKILDKINETSKLLSGWLLDDLAAAGLLAQMGELPEMDEGELEAADGEVPQGGELPGDGVEGTGAEEAETVTEEGSIDIQGTVTEDAETLEEEEDNEEQQQPVEETPARRRTIAVLGQLAAEGEEAIAEIEGASEDEASEDEMSELPPSLLSDELGEEDINDVFIEEALAELTMEELAEEGYIEITDEGITRPITDVDLEKLEDERTRLGLPNIIRGHKPSRIVEHTPDTVCCLSLKLWAVWLLDVIHNAEQWSKSIYHIINQIRHYVAIVRGDVLLPNGEQRVLFKTEWIDFAKDTEEKIIAWRQYSAHVKDLSKQVIENFHGKSVNCCPKCLQDHLIKDVVSAHETLQALAEAINCASYWQRTLDEIVVQTAKLTSVEMAGKLAEDKLEAKPSSSSSDDYIIEEIDISPRRMHQSAPMQRPRVYQQPCQRLAMPLYSLLPRPQQQRPRRPQPNYNNDNDDDDSSVYEIEEVTSPKCRF